MSGIVRRRETHPGTGVYPGRPASGQGVEHIADQQGQRDPPWRQQSAASPARQVRVWPAGALPKLEFLGPGTCARFGRAAASG